MLTDPTIWETLKTPIQVIGSTTLIAGVAWMVRWTWGLRGIVDNFINDQKADRALAHKTLEGVEAAKKTAIQEIEVAKKHGETKAEELREKIEANTATVKSLDTNHLAHIETGILGLVDIAKSNLAISTDMKESLAVISDRTTQIRRKSRA